MERWAKIAFAALCVAVAVGTLVYPTYPNYDSYYSLLWGRELLHGHLPHFEGFRLPTEHPLAIAAGVVLNLFGHAGDRLWIVLILASFLALVAAIYRLGRVAFTPLVGVVAALLLLSRFDFGFRAARGYIDVPYLALVAWAVALEAGRPRRGTPVFALLTAAGLLRPEGWLALGLYFLWMWPASDWRQRAVWALWTVAAPVGWGLVDGIVTGDPLFSLHYTSDSAEDLGRAKTLGQIPGAIPGFLTDIVKLPVMLAGGVGLLAAVLLAPRRVVWPAVLLVTGVATFLAIGLAGLSAIERYLVVAALGVLVSAAFAVAGWTLLEPGTRLRRAWAGAAAVVVAFVAVLTAVHLDVRHFDNELRFRGEAHAGLQEVLDAPAVRAGLRCGPLTLPNHKLVPDSRWAADEPFERVSARVQRRRAQRRGVALVVLGRFAIFNQAWTSDVDPSAVQLPPVGWKLAARSPGYAAYARC
ncbi:MAG: hypothetical protein ACR2J6_00270 [Thermoleophilaceae bacterium]